MITSRMAFTALRNSRYFSCRSSKRERDRVAFDGRVTAHQRVLVSRIVPTFMADITQTDVSRPSALPTARLRPNLAHGQSSVDQTSDEYLDTIEEEWNKKIDVEIETLVDGMVDIVNLASVSFYDIHHLNRTNDVSRLVTRISSR